MAAYLKYSMRKTRVDILAIRSQLIVKVVRSLGVHLVVLVSLYAAGHNHVKRHADSMVVETRPSVSCVGSLAKSHSQIELDNELQPIQHRGNILPDLRFGQLGVRG
jgi:hypothetical protein